MFMGREELVNTWILMKLKFKANKWMFFVLIAGTIISVVFESFIAIFLESGPFIIPIVANTFLLTIWLIWPWLQYNQVDEEYQYYDAFPTTRLSRVLSSQMIFYVGIVLYFLLVALLYGLFIGWLHVSFGDKLTITSLPTSLFIAGLFVNMMYYFLLVAMFLFIRHLVNQYLMVPMVMAVMLLLDWIFGWGVLQALWDFMIGETSLVIFFIKTIAIWLCLFFATLSLAQKASPNMKGMGEMKGWQRLYGYFDKRFIQNDREPKKFGLSLIAAPVISLVILFSSLGYFSEYTEEVETWKVHEEKPFHHVIIVGWSFVNFFDAYKGEVISSPDYLMARNLKRGDTNVDE